jgi:hypothetical protein
VKKEKGGKKVTLRAPRRDESDEEEDRRLGIESVTSSEKGEIKKMERQTKKVKNKGDTCRDCWTTRFNNDIYEQWEKEQGEAKPGKIIALSEFLNRELEARELVIKNMREELGDLYDEMTAIEHLAGDIYMGRFDRDKKD